MRKHRATASDSAPEFNRTGVEFLLTELEVALTFLKVAEGTRIRRQRAGTI
jgi:hypothetical protein